MAIYHLSMSIISRKAGRSSTAAAAYRSATKIADERTGLMFDYRKKSGVVSAELVLPAGVPAALSEREALWNGVEKKNRRGDSQVAREITIALPDELSAGDRADLAREFARHIADTYSVGVDLAIHMPSKGGSDKNHHAHLLLTTNRLDSKGLGNKVRELDPIAHGMNKKQREKKNAADVLREAWADLANRKLEQAGQSARVDHRSHKDRGIEDEPTIHVGPTATAMDRDSDDVISDRGKINKAINRANYMRRSRHTDRHIRRLEDLQKAIRRSQQAREQARRQQPPAPSPAHGSAAVALDQDRASSVDMLAAGLLGIDDEVAQRQQQAKRDQALAAMRQHMLAERQQALAAVAEFRAIVEPRAAEIAAQAITMGNQIEQEQQRVIDAKRELAAARPRAPGVISRMVGGAGRYQRREAAWSAKAGELDDTARDLSTRYDAEHEARIWSGDIAARELARENPDLVRLAEKGMVIETEDRKAREVERQRKKEIKRLEQAKAKQLARIQRDAKQRVIKKTREDGKAKLEAERQQQTQAWIKDSIDQLLAGVSDNGEQARILASEREQWLRNESYGEARREWREYGVALDARITALEVQQPGNEQTREGQRRAEGPRRRSRGPGM